MNRSFSFATPRLGSLVVASLALLCADPSSSAEAHMIELQSLQGQRATTLQVATGAAKSMREGSNAVAGNMGGTGAGTPPVAAPRAHRGSLNPQPLPPAERSGSGVGVGVGKRDRSALPNGIIIVGGKPAAGR